jgi:hypothetical protein
MIDAAFLTPERELALSDAAFLEALAASFLKIRVRPKGADKGHLQTAQAGTQEFLQRAERLHAIAQRLRGMQ